MKQIDKNALGENYLDQNKKEQFLVEALNDETTINQNVELLAKDEIIIKDVETLKKVSPEWLRKFVDDSKATFYGSTKGYTPISIRQKFEADFEAVYSRNADYCNDIRNALKSHAVKIEKDPEGYFRFDEAELEKEAIKFATRTFDADTQEYYSLLSELVEHINEVAAWEKSHYLNSFTTKGYFVQGFNGAMSFTQSMQEILSVKDKNNKPTGVLRIDRDVFVNLLTRGVIGPNPQI